MLEMFRALFRGPRRQEAQLAQAQAPPPPPQQQRQRQSQSHWWSRAPRWAGGSAFVDEEDSRLLVSVERPSTEAPFEDDEDDDHNDGNYNDDVEALPPSPQQQHQSHQRSPPPTPSYFYSPRPYKKRTLLPWPRSPLASRCAMFVIIVLLLIAGWIAYLWHNENKLRAWAPFDAEAKLFSERPLLPPQDRTRISNYELPLRTSGRNIVDQKGRRFKLSSVNWYGASDELFVPGGLDVQHRNVIAQTIRRLGFNSVRLPYADEIVVHNPLVKTETVTANPDLIGLRALDVLEASVAALTDAGIAVIVNNHITSATWCCGADPCDAGWANDHLPVGVCRVRQTEDQWIANWENVMERFKENPLVIGADLRNEVRGLWGTMPWGKWAAAAERCGNRLLKMNSDWLIVVEGTESANDLSGARDRPVRLDVPDRLVYSAHIYKWSGWGSREGRFAQRSYASFVKTMRHNWAYLLEREIAPVWIGELGAPRNPTVGDAHYWNNMFKYLKAIDADFGYWAINPRKPAHNANESYSLVRDDWVTPVLDYRMKDMTELMNA